MALFGLAVPGTIRFGPGAAAELGDIAVTLGSKALVVTGHDQTRHQTLVDGLRTAGIAVTRFSIGNEPTVDDLRRGAEEARRAGCNLVVSIGGGSAVDTGKAIAALCANPGDVMDYLEVIGAGRPLDQQPVPHVAVPTTAGTGSEVTKNAVVLSEEHGVKVSMRSPRMVPTVALVDPELTYSLPRAATVNSGLDALTHLLESYVSVKANPLVDPFCEDGIKRAARSLRRAADAPDETARLDMALAGLYGGIALANAGLGAVHGLVGVLGGRLHVAHGLACGCLLAPVFGVNVAALDAGDSPVRDRYDKVARLLTGDPSASARDGVDWLAALTTDLDLPGLGEYGLVSDLYAGIAADAVRSSSMKGNPVQLTQQDLEAILAKVS